MVFTLPDVRDSGESWGPPVDEVPADYDEVPYAPFGKGDKLGKCADWTQTGYGKFGGCARPQHQRRSAGARPSTGAAAFFGFVSLFVELRALCKP